MAQGEKPIQPKRQQGKAWDKDKVVEVLKPYFLRGNNVNKACMKAGIAASTFKTWLENDPELRLKVDNWRSQVNEKAREVWIKHIQDGDYKAAKEWLERHPGERGDFSPLQNINHTGDINVTLWDKLDNKITDGSN